VPAAPVVNLGDTVQALLSTAVPGASLYVAGAAAADDRAVQKPLWKAHRARFIAAGDFAGALAAAAVLQALSEQPRGTLVAAHVVSDGGELLVWFDLRGGQVLASFPDARVWGVGF
jgi:hypothetical protein